MTSKVNNLILSDDEVAGVWFVDALGSDHTLLMHERLGIEDADYNLIVVGEPVCMRLDSTLLKCNLSGSAETSESSDHGLAMTDEEDDARIKHVHLPRLVPQHPRFAPWNYGCPCCYFVKSERYLLCLFCVL